MGKGGRYLKPKEKKKGRGWKIALIVLAVIVVLLGGVVYVGVHYYNSLLDLIPRAVYEHKDVSVDDVMDAATYNPDKYATGD
ncbi:MAG: hypothetical protein ACI4PH_02020 [Faecousia sp.]